MAAAVEQGYPQVEIAQSSYEFQRDIEAGDRKIVGVNISEKEQSTPSETLRIEDRVTQSQIDKLMLLKSSRDRSSVKEALQKLRADVRANCNLMPAIVEAAHVYATLVEMCDVLRSEFGIYEEKIAV